LGQNALIGVNGFEAFPFGVVLGTVCLSPQFDRAAPSVLGEVRSVLEESILLEAKALLGSLELCDSGIHSFSGAA